MVNYGQLWQIVVNDGHMELCIINLFDNRHFGKPKIVQGIGDQCGNHWGWVAPILETPQSFIKIHQRSGEMRDFTNLVI